MGGAVRYLANKASEVSQEEPPRSPLMRFTPRVKPLSFLLIN